MDDNEDERDHEIMNCHKRSPQVNAWAPPFVFECLPKSRDRKAEAAQLYDLGSPQALNNQLSHKALSAARYIHHEACYESLLEMFPREPLAAKHD